MGALWTTRHLLLLSLLPVASAALAPSLAHHLHRSALQSVPSIVAVCEPIDHSTRARASQAFESPDHKEQPLRAAKERLARSSGAKRRSVWAASASVLGAASSATASSAIPVVRQRPKAMAEPPQASAAASSVEDGEGRGQVRVRARPIVAQAAAVVAPPKLSSAVDRLPPITITGTPRSAPREPAAPSRRDQAAVPGSARSSVPHTTDAADAALLPIIKVLGVGGGGGNTVARIPAALSSMLDMMGEGAAASSLATVEMCLLNTDEQALTLSSRTAADAADAADAARDDASGRRLATGSQQMMSVSSVQLGAETLGGRGAGGDPAQAERAAEAQAAQITHQVGDANLVFITAGLGGGTGSGAAPVVARLARAAGALVVGVVSTPFHFEGASRQDVAYDALRRLEPHCDVLVVVHNEKLLEVLPQGMSLVDTMHAADDVARQAIVGVAAMLSGRQMINIDFCDVRAVMQDAGRGLISIGRARGAGAAHAAVRAALSSPLLDIELT